MRENDVDAVIVGAGFAGLYMLHRLRGLGLSARVFEAGDDVGGTWYWNRYPGARCDVESMEYSFSFDEHLQQEWDWTERYATQPEILRYAQHVAERFDLRRDITFSTRVESAHYDEASDRWTVTTDGGETVSARYCVMATGCLSSPQVPGIPGIADFEGPTYMTGLWPHEGVDFTGQKVAVIGTGSSAIQSIPLIAKQASALTVYQRTPNYIAPAHNHPLDPDYVADVKAHYPDFREEARDTAIGIRLPFGPPEQLALAVPDAEREAHYRKLWDYGGLTMLASYADIGIDLRANETIAEFLRARIREKVRDPETAEKLCPKDYPAGAKRMCVDIGYYETFNLDHVHLVDINEEPIERLTATGIDTATGHRDFDAIVFATGFDAMTGTLGKIDIRGRGGAKLADKWAAGPRAYLGLMSAGFPNLFLITGPGSPSVLSNMIVSIEQHVGWIADCLAAIGGGTIEPLTEAEDAWVEHVNMIAQPTIYMRANSWYLGANIPGKPRIFMPYVGGVNSYRSISREVADKGYAGFAVNGAPNAEIVDFAAHIAMPDALMDMEAA
ncbi:flavin-containing monooxygenase [Parasphingopyxis marina]|uniref:NAD(P)/FAD-dependent oxidoreductase n=1 Tax=Parasphingopyxis marina TaxID=2761622 RepID=A0A842HWY8_9SPHN|nr:NAD(P)/FAD-dependent oxidoreductase [Parasphingopyxis marina]MBC2776460.1 NAD(P)/FAD-dependent oxidoreductase [Parasphingopyxis marina]